MSFMIFLTKHIKNESEKPTIASTTSDFFDGYVKTTVLCQSTSKILPKIVKTHSFFSSDAIFTF